MKIIKKISHCFLILSFVFIPVIILAQSPPPPANPPLSITIPNPVAGDPKDLGSLLTTLLNNVVMPVATVFVVVWIIYAGFKYVTAQGNPAKITEAHKTLLWSLIGAGILLGAAGISLVVQNTIGDLLK